VKEVKAILRPTAVDEVVHALQHIEGLPGLTVSHVQGFGRLKGHDCENPIQACDMKAKLEVVIPDGLLEPVLAAIAGAASTGRPGDGKVFVYDVADALKLRTGERGEKAI
jgi:nitrogen regulatory protein P-II 1